MPVFTYFQHSVGSTGAQITRKRRSFHQGKHHMPQLLLSVQCQPNRIPHFKRSDMTARSKIGSDPKIVAGNLLPSSMIVGKMPTRQIEFQGDMGYGFVRNRGVRKQYADRF
jgi:hypothetical protein